MAKIKKLTPVLLLVFYALAALYMFRERLSVQGTYNVLLEQARAYAQDGILVEAMDSYESALAIRPSVELELEAGQLLLDSGEYHDARNWYEDELLAKYPESPETYAYGIEVCTGMDAYDEAFECYDKYCRRKLSDDRVESLMNQIWYSFDVLNTYEQVSAFSNLSHTAAVREDDLWGYVDTTGHRVLEYQFREAGVFSDTAAVIGEDGEARYIDVEGNTRYNARQIERVNPEFGAVEAFRPIYSGLILASNGAGWSYFHVDDFHQAFDGLYEDAYPIVNGTGAVQNASGKWALISEDGSTTEFQYDEVAADAKGIINRTGAVLVRFGGQYHLVDGSGQPMTEQTYSSVCPFYDSTYAAVERDGQWVFVDAEGRETAFDAYDEARSFSGGLAAVRRGTQWGYINQQGELVIPCQFDDAGPFSDDGAAFVHHIGKGWDLIKLYKSVSE